MTSNPEFVSNFSVDWSLHDNVTNESDKFVAPITITIAKDIETVLVSSTNS